MSNAKKIREGDTDAGERAGGENPPREGCPGEEGEHGKTRRQSAEGGKASGGQGDGYTACGVRGMSGTGEHGDGREGTWGRMTAFAGMGEKWPARVRGATSSARHASRSRLPSAPHRPPVRSCPHVGHGSGLPCPSLTGGRAGTARTWPAWGSRGLEITPHNIGYVALTLFAPVSGSPGRMGNGPPGSAGSIRGQGGKGAAAGRGGLTRGKGKGYARGHA